MPLITAAAVKNRLFNIVMTTITFSCRTFDKSSGITRYHAANIKQLVSGMGGNPT